jgi:hypothetical protein
LLEVPTLQPCLQKIDLTETEIVVVVEERDRA